MELPSNGRCRLGESQGSGMLGMNVVIGSHKWECHQKFRIVFGPLALSEYQRVLPGGETLARLVALVRNYVGDELTWDVNVILDKEEVPPLELGRMGQLGWTTWLTSEPAQEAASDLYLTPLEYTH
jgi:type VI secretion system protein ImpH